MSRSSFQQLSQNVFCADSEWPNKIGIEIKINFRWLVFFGGTLGRNLVTFSFKDWKHRKFPGDTYCSGSSPAPRPQLAPTDNIAGAVQHEAIRRRRCRTFCWSFGTKTKDCSNRYCERRSVCISIQRGLCCFLDRWVMLEFASNWASVLLPYTTHLPKKYFRALQMLSIHF